MRFFRCLRRTLLSLMLFLLVAEGAYAEAPAAGVFSLFADVTPTPAATSTPSPSPAESTPTAPPSPTPGVTPPPPLGFTLEIISQTTNKAQPEASFRVLIYHTHTYEAYTATKEMAYTPTEKWRTSNSERNVVAVGACLASLLENAGVEVVHDTTAFEPPKLSTAYERSLAMLTQRTAGGEAYDLYIDMHRDAYCEGNGPNTIDHDGESLARLLFLIGKGTGQTGAGYAEKPDWESNRRIAQALTNRINLQCEGLCRNVSLKNGRYNQHVAPRCVLIEVGNNYNTLEEALAAMPYLANAICALADGQVE